MSEEIQILLTALDNASKTIADASSSVKTSLGQVESAAAQVEKTQRRTENSSKDLALGINNVATSGFSLYESFDRIEKAQLAVDRANLQVQSTTNSLEDAQRRYNDAVEKFGSDSEQAKSALADVQVAQERHNVAVERADIVQNDYNQTQMRLALSVVPTVVTGIDGLYKAYKNIPDISGTLSKLSSGFVSTGISAKTAALGVAGFVGGFLAGDAILKAVPENIRGIASALMVGIGAIVAATVAWMALQGTMTMGVAVPVILAAVGAGIAGVKGLMGMAEGGVVSSPTVALIGEAGPEAVIPLNRANNFHDFGQQQVAVNLTINIDQVNSPADVAMIKDAALEAVSEGVRRRS
jgi:hypothetical protein